MKTTKAELERRVEFVLRLRLQGAESWDIHPLVSADGDPYPDGHGPAWGVCVETIRRYIRLADVRLAEVTDRRREEFVNRHLAQRRMLFARAVQQSDYRAALAVLDSEAKLLDLFPRAKSDPTAVPDGADRVTIELPPKDAPPTRRPRPMPGDVIRAQPGPQRQFFSNDADIVVYGGAAGGGKSFALLLDPLRYVGVPGFRGVVFRRTYPQITEGGGL